MELEKAKQILYEAKANEYTDDEIREILKFLSNLATVSINNILKKSKNE